MLMNLYEKNNLFRRTLPDARNWKKIAVMSKRA